MEQYLMHHGIKGQKWGVRRFQNYDGSYTEKGKKRYGYFDLVTDINTARNPSAYSGQRLEAYRRITEDLISKLDESWRLNDSERLETYEAITEKLVDSLSDYSIESVWEASSFLDFIYDDNDNDDQY